MLLCSSFGPSLNDGGQSIQLIMESLEASLVCARSQYLPLRLLYLEALQSELQSISLAPFAGRVALLDDLCPPPILPSGQLPRALVPFLDLDRFPPWSDQPLLFHLLRRNRRICQRLVTNGFVERLFGSWKCPEADGVRLRWT